MQIGQLHQGWRCPPARADHLHAGGFGGEGAYHLGRVQQAKGQHWIEFVEHHHGIEVAGDGAFGDIPAPLGLLAIEGGGLLGIEVVPPAGAHLVDQVGKALLQRFDGAVFVVGATGTFEKAKQENAGSLLLADAQADGAQHHPQGRLAFALAIAVINMQLAPLALIATCRRADADAPARAPLGHAGHGLGACCAALARGRQGT